MVVVIKDHYTFVPISHILQILYEIGLHEDQGITSLESYCPGVDKYECLQMLDKDPKTYLVAFEGPDNSEVYEVPLEPEKLEAFLIKLDEYYSPNDDFENVDQSKVSKLLKTLNLA
jgi:hypothetical protein